MKIKPEHFEHMEKEITGYLDRIGKEKIVARYESGDFPRSERVKDLQRRFCFDLLYFSGLTMFVTEHIYFYVDDNHLYTALKRICPKIKRKY